MEKCPWAREKHLVAKLAHLQVEMKRVGESHAQEKRDLILPSKCLLHRDTFPDTAIFESLSSPDVVDFTTEHFSARVVVVTKTYISKSSPKLLFLVA
uniref:Uncharacterized protein n=1 Tax=Timema cristinae TaxID=61476 RepID=A0A7R9CRK9_TIMCR|nr:unnamed protein product [Timema cristinae]